MNDKQQRVLAQANDLAARGHNQQAIDLLELLAEAAADAAVWNRVAHLYVAELAYEQAVEAFGHALACGAARAEDVHANRGRILAHFLRRPGLAEKDFRAALALDPHHAPALHALGVLQEKRGEPKRALAAYDRLMAAPSTAHADHPLLLIDALARSARLRPATSADDPLLVRLQRAAEGQPDKAARANLLFSLAQSQEHVGAHDAAFETYVRANRWMQRSSGRRHDRALTRRAFDALIAASPRAADVGLDAFAGHRAEPLFICGLFRSGCALLERALAAHPQVTAGGPMLNLRRLIHQIAPFPAGLTSLDPARAAGLARQYRSGLAKMFPKGIRGGYITDSRPDNVLLIGMIKLLFPGARIVHTVRNPLDTGVAIFARRLPLQVADYAGDLGDIGHFIGQHARLMDHYRQRYPGGIIDFDYDAFVANPVNRLAALLDDLHLPWHDQCLALLQTSTDAAGKRRKTAADVVDGRASGRWRHFANRLEPLQRELRAAGVLADDVPARTPRATFS